MGRRRAAGLYDAISDLDRTLAICSVSKFVTPVFVEARQVFSHAIVIAYDDDFHFGVISSSHYRWACRCPQPGDRFRYRRLTCSRHSQPPFSDAVESAGLSDRHRSARMIEANEGPTDTYNRVHDETDRTVDIVRLRELTSSSITRCRRVRVGRSSAGSRFHPVRGQGIRYTFSPDAAVGTSARSTRRLRRRSRSRAAHRQEGETAIVDRR